MTNLQNLILSIRDIIPDRTDGEDPHIDGRAFSLTTILRWINEAGDLIAHNANVIEDWFGVPSIVGQSVYELPDFITSVEQVYYNTLPLDRSAENENLFTVNRSGNSWWFSPHAIHVIPKLFLFPSPADPAATTQLNGGITDSALNATVDDSSNFNVYGMMKIESEIIRYATVPTATTITNLLRAQTGTTAAAHADNTTVTDLNITMKVFRLPRHVESADDVLELPRGLHSLVEMYALSKALSAEQDTQSAAAIRQEFFGLVERLSAKPATQGLRQGTQVRLFPGSASPSNVRVYIP